MRKSNLKKAVLLGLVCSNILAGSALADTEVKPAESENNEVVVTADGWTLGGAGQTGSSPYSTIYGGYSPSCSVTSNAVTMSSGTVSGDVYGGFILWGDAENTGNSVKITGGIYGGSIFGGYSNKDVVGGNSADSGNEVSISGATTGDIKSVYGGYGKGASYNKVKIDSSYTGTVTGDSRVGSVVGGYSSSAGGDSEYNSVTIAGGTYSKYVSGGYAAAGNAGKDGKGNAVILSGGIFNDSVYGGCASGTTGNAGYNSVSVVNGTVGAVSLSGGYSNKGKVEYNEVTIGGGTAATVVNSPNAIYGGYAAHGGDGTNNCLSVTGNAVVNGNDTAGVVIQGGYSGEGKAENNSVMINLDDTCSISKVVSVAGGVAKGLSKGNNVAISCGFLEGLTSGMVLYGGQSTTNAAEGNSVSISGANTKITNLKTLIGGQGVSAGGEGKGNSVVISNGEISCLTGIQIVGGLSQSGGDVSYNEVNISGGKIRAAVTGGTVTQIAGGISATGSVTHNVLEITGGELQDVYYLNGAYGNVSVTDNRINISNAQITGIAAGAKLTAGSSDNGTATDNTITISSGTLNGINTMRGGNGTTATGNKIEIYGGKIDGISTGLQIIGGKATGGAAENNKVNISGGVLTNVKEIIGGYGKGNYAANNNEINISGGTFCGNIYGGYSEDGTTSGNKISVTGITAVYLGTGLMKADSAVSLDGTFTIGTGTTASTLTITKGISVAAEKTSSLVGDSITNISTLAGAISNAGTLSISNLNISNTINNTGTLNVEKVTLNANVSGGMLNVAGGLTQYAGSEVIGAKTIVKSGGQLDPAANLLNVDTTVESGGELYLSSGTLSVGIKGEGTTYLQASPSVDEDQTITVNSNLTIVGILNGSGSTIDMTGGSGSNQYTTLTVGKLAGTTNLKIDLDMSNAKNVDKMSIGAVETTGTVLNLSDINITADYVVTSGGTLTLPTKVNNGVTYVAQTGGYNSSNLTYQVNGATGSLVKNSIVTNRYIYTFTLGDKGKLNYEITATSSDAFKDFIEGKLSNVPQTLSLTDDLADANANMANNTTCNELTININDGKELGTATGNTVTIADGDTLNLNGGATTAGIVYTGWNVESGGKLNLGGKLQLNGTISGAGTTEIKGNVDLNGGTITPKIIKMDTANASLDNVGVISGNESDSKIELTAGTIGSIGTVYGGYSQYGSATSNEVSMSGGTVSGDVYGGYVFWGNENTGNSVTITGGTYGGSIFGGYSNKDEVGGNSADLGNKVNISSASQEDGKKTGNIKAVYGGHGNGAGYNQVTIESSYTGTVTQDGRGFSIAGGYSIGGGDSVHNSVSIASGTYENYVSGGYAYTNSGTGTGNGNNNTVTLSGGTFKSEVFGGYAAGAIGGAESNSVSITGTIEAVKLFGGYSIGGTANKNSVTISDANAKITNLQVLVGGQGVNVGGENKGNSVSISAGEITCLNDSQILGGLSTSTNGDVSYNNVNISGGKIKAAVTGGTVTQIAGGISTTGSVIHNVLSITGGELQDVYYLNGAYGNVSVTDNKINISNAQITGIAAGAKLTAGSSDSGTATENVLNISSGTLDEVNTIRGGHGITATDNVINISGGSIDGISDGMEIIGGKTTTGPVSGNKVNISNGNLTDVEAIYGGYSDSGNVTGNEVNISGGTFGGDIYGGYSEQGTPSDNTIIITGTTATYLGSGLMQADSAVTLGDGTNATKFTVGNGTDAAVLTFVSGLNILDEGELFVTNNASVTLQGTSTLFGAVTGEGNLTNTGILTTDITKIAGTITNTGTFNMSGNLTKSIAGTGTTVMQSDIVNATTADVVIEGTLDGNSKTIDMQDSGTAAYTTLTVGTLAGTTNLKIDVDMSDTIMVDTLSIGAAESGTVLNLSAINITKDYIVTSGGTITVPTDVANGIIYVTGDGAASENLTYKIDDKTKAEGGSLESKIATSNYIYTFTLGDKGKLNYSFTTVEPDNVFQSFIEGKLVNVPQTMSVTDNMGDANADMASNITYDTLNIHVNDGKTLGTAVVNTVTLGKGDTINLQGGTTTAGVVYTSWTVAKGGTLNFSGKLDEQGVITNAGTLNLNNEYASTTPICNTGTLNVAADNLKADVTNSDGTVNLGAGELEQVITGGAITTTGNVKTDVNNLKSNLGITNGYEMTLTGGTDAGQMDSLTDVINGGSSTDSVTIIDGFITSKRSITQNKVKINAGKKLEIVKDEQMAYAYLNADVDNAGTLSINADHLVGDVDNSEGAVVELTGGTLEDYTITGGTLNVTAPVTTSADNLKVATVNNIGSLALTGGSLTVALAGTLSNSGELTTAAGNLDAVLTNTGTVNLTAGTLENTISGGTLNLTGDVITNADYIQSNTNIVAAGKVLTLTGGTLSKDLTGDIKDTGTLTVTGTITGKIDNDSTLNLSSIYTSDTAIDNDGTLNVTADNLKAEVANENGIVNLGSGRLSQAITGGNVAISGNVTAVTDNFVNADVTALSGGNLTLTGGTFVKALTAKDGGIINLTLTDYSQATSYDTTSGGTINIKGGTITNKFVGGAEMDELNVNLTSGTKLTLTDNGAYNSLAQYIFSDGNTLAETKPESVSVTATNKFNFAGGVLEVTDYEYTYVYLQAIKEAVDGMNTNTKLTMKGTLKNAEQVGEATLTTEQAATIGQNVNLPQVTVKVEAKGEENVANTLIGSVTTNKVEVEGVGEVRDKQAEGFNVNKLDLAADKDDPSKTVGVVITNDKAVVLGGSMDEAGGKKSNLISVGGDDTKSVNVVVGVAENEKIDGTTSTKGTLGIGIEGSTNKNGYQLNGNLTVNKDSEVKVNGDVQITGNVTLDDAKLNAAEGTLTTVDGTMAIKNDSIIAGNVVVSELDLDDSSMTVAKGAKVVTGNLKAGSTTKEDQTQQSGITGNVTVENTMTVSGAEVTSEEKNVTILVGDKDNKAVLSVGNIILGSEIDSKWYKGVIFADPAWKEGNNPISEASSIATATTTLDGSYIAGQNSVIAFGTTDTTEAEKAFADSQLVWGKEEGQITAAAYIYQNVDLGNYGGIMVDGSLTASPGVQDDCSLILAANSLLMVNGNICMDSAAIKNIDKLTVADSAKLYIANALIDTTYCILAGEGVSDGTTMWDTENIILSDILDVKEIKIQDNVYQFTTKAADKAPEYIAKTVAGDAYDVMRKADNTTEASKFISAACDVRLSESDKIAILNRNADMPEEVGVMHNHYNVTNMTEDAVAKHLALDEHTQGREIWAQGIHSKEHVNGFGLSTQGNNYSTQYNGTVVGVDIMNNSKTILGAAITYIDGKATAAGSHNEGKYYGATIYGRTKLGKDAGVQYDVSYIHSSNDMTLASGCSYGQITGDQDVNSFSVGARVEQEIKAGHSTSFVPHVGARWLRMKGDSFTNSLGNSYKSDTTNSLIIPLGVSFKASMHSEGWKMSFLADAGYQWNTGDREYRQHFGYNGVNNSFDVNFVDSNGWYAGAGLEFNRKNFTAGVGYRYSKSDSTRQNKWNVNLAWSF